MTPRRLCGRPIRESPTKSATPGGRLGSRAFESRQFTLKRSVSWEPGFERRADADVDAVWRHRVGEVRKVQERVFVDVAVCRTPVSWE